MNPSILADVVTIYEGSNGDATKRMYDLLTELGPIGTIAVNLFRAQKASERAKVYRGGGYRGMAYDRKQWSIDNLSAALTEHAAGAGIQWGWGLDPIQEYHNVVIYVDLPTGQVSFHTSTRGKGPDYPGKWDGHRGASPGRICRWVAQLLSEKETA